MLSFQNLELGGDIVDGGALGKKICKAEKIKLKYKNIQNNKGMLRNLRYGGDKPSLAFKRLSWSWIACWSSASFLFSRSISDF